MSEINQSGAVTTVRIDYSGGNTEHTLFLASDLHVDATTGDITITLSAGVTKELIPGNYTYDIQLIEADEVSTLTGGTLIIIPDTTRLVA